MARLIKVDGSDTELLPTSGGKFTLKEMQTAVGGLVEVLHLPNGKFSAVIGLRKMC
jgi:hypothetical protein